MESAYIAYSFHNVLPTSVKIIIVLRSVCVVGTIWIVTWMLMVYSFWIVGDPIDVDCVVRGTTRLWYTLAKIPVAAMRRDRLTRDRMGWTIDVIAVDAQRHNENGIRWRTWAAEGGRPQVFRRFRLCYNILRGERDNKLN